MISRTCFLFTVLLIIATIKSTDHKRKLPRPTQSPLKSELTGCYINEWHSYPNFPKTVPKRKDCYTTTNDYHIDVPLCSSILDYNSSRVKKCGEFHSVLYYVNSTHGGIIVRRLDDYYWHYSFNITIIHKLKSNSSTKTQQVAIPPHVESWLYITFRTPEELLKEVKQFQQQIIPKTIIQTYFTYKAINVYHWNAYFTFIDLNPEYEISLLLDKDCRNFIKTHLPGEVLDAYDVLIPGAFQADLFRYSYLYIRGGCYFDNKMINLVPLRNILHTSDDFVVCSDCNPGGKFADTLATTTKLYNAIICAKPKDPRLLHTIKHVVENIRSREVRIGGDLALTGPVAFYNSVVPDITETNVRLKHGYSYRDPSNSHPNRKYNEYVVQDKATKHTAFYKTFKGYYTSDNATHRNGGYSQQWIEKRVFYDSPILYLGRYKIFMETFLRKSIGYEILSNGSVSLTFNTKGTDIRDKSISKLLSQKLKSNTSASYNDVISLDSNYEVYSPTSGRHLHPDCSRGESDWFNILNQSNKLDSRNRTRELFGSTTIFDWSQMTEWLHYFVGSTATDDVHPLVIKIIDDSSSEQVIVRYNPWVYCGRTFVIPLCLPTVS